MKQTVGLFLIIIACAFSVKSQVSAGLMLGSSLNSHSEKTAAPNSVESSNSQFGLDIGPVFRFMISSKAEVAPFLGLSIDNHSVKSGDGSTTSTDNTGMFYGCGLYFFMAENSLFKFSLGPRLHGGFWFTKTDTDIGVNMPLNFDVSFAGPWSIRASASVIDIWYSYSDIGGTRSGDFNYNMMSIFMPELSFFVTF